MEEEELSGNTITFLGTAGARFMVSKQLAASGGMWFAIDGTQVLVDPGPGCIVQATRRKLKSEKLDGIIVSHRHLDHSADVNVMVEAMTEGGFHPHGKLFLPSDALGCEPVVFSYLKNYLGGIEQLVEGGSYSVGNISFTTPIRHMHSVETYGMVFEAAGHQISYITDTLYFPGLGEHYTGELAIISTLLLEPREGVQHLSVPDVERLIGELKPKVAILTHFGTMVWRNKPWEIAERMSQNTGAKVIAARDGMRFDLSRLDG